MCLVPPKEKKTKHKLFSVKEYQSDDKSIEPGHFKHITKTSLKVRSPKNSSFTHKQEEEFNMIFTYIPLKSKH